MMNLTHWLRMSALCMLCLAMAALSGNAADNSATTDLSANAVRDYIHRSPILRWRFWREWSVVRGRNPRFTLLR
jgi:hypothetical protein